MAVGKMRKWRRRKKTGTGMTSSAVDVDEFAQARKILADRTPFEEPEQNLRVTTLPVRLANFLARNSDSKKKSSQKSNFWAENEAFFRPIDSSDVDLLESRKKQINSSLIDPVFKIPRKNDEIDESGGSGGDYSMNWVLGSKQRGFVGLEKPNKKRKLTSSEGGLKRLMFLPSDSGERSRICDFCCSGLDHDPKNRLITCGSCKVTVHTKCYGVSEDVSGDWLCSWCKSEGKSSTGSCVLCPKKGGALKIVGMNADQRKFAHLFCGIWVPEVVVGSVEKMEPILNADETRKKHVCSVCRGKQGACIRCGHGSCQSYFHPTCARDSGLRMEIWGRGKSDDVELIAFCAKHSCLHDGSSDQGSENLSEKDHDNALASSSKVQRIKITCKGRENNIGKDTPGVESISGNGLLPEDCAILPKNERITSDDRICDLHNGSSDVKDLLLILKKLSERGKLKVPEVAKEMGIPPEFLEPIVRGQTTSLSSDFKLKIVKWFQDYVHLGGPERHLTSAVSSADGANVGSGLLKSLPSRRTKNDATGMKDEVFDEDSGLKDVSTDSNGKQNPENVERDSLTLQESDYSSKVRDILTKMEGGFSNNTSQLSSLGNSGNGNPGESLAPGGAANPAGPFLSKETKSFPGARMHPFIEEKLNRIQHSMNCREEAANSMETDLLMKNCSNLVSRPMSDVILDEKDNCSDVVEFSPEDELEGEILYLQNKLLDTVVIIKQRCEKLMQSIIKVLPEELNSQKKQRWDLVVVNQYMRQLKEAKKRGRKEKRRREYQAVLAAATAGTETSSRGSSQRKEKTDAPPQQEGNAGDRPGTLASQAKENRLKFATPKVTLEKRAGVHEDLCDICGQPETMLNKIFVCGRCKVAVHLDCYLRPKSSISTWSCEACEESIVAQCGFCGAKTGAFRKTKCGRWVHNVCAEWILQSTFRRGQENPIEGMGEILSGTETLSCEICHQRTGACIKCGQADCQASFHPFCAKKAGMVMIIKNIAGKVHRIAYCKKHGSEHKLKDGIQRYSAEELKNIKLIRVELEKVRLLCERIIRREKLKRDVVLCSHEVLASKRDYFVSSSRVDSSSYGGGFSSESATTSMRSDDFTVESSISTKRRPRVSFKRDQEGKADGGSHMQLQTASAKKRADRTALGSGKSVPRKLMGSQSATAGKESRLKPKKPEIFQKEVMMTSDQASAQNRRLPKGFVYVPVDSLPKSETKDSLEHRRPDG